MKLICPECKNDIDLSAHSDLKKDQVIECGMCGITLAITELPEGDSGEVKAEIVDEGK
jgi:ribosomal protein S27E